MLHNEKEGRPMRSRDQLMQRFVESHRHPVNVRIHMICVPLIVASTLGLAWLLPLGRWLGLPEPLAGWVNLATFAALPIGLFYLRLSLGSFLTMAVWFSLSIAAVLVIQAAGWPLLAICAATWVATWIVQIHGHRVEGKKPSASDDAVFFLIGPLFVTDRLRK